MTPSSVDLARQILEAQSLTPGPGGHALLDEFQASGVRFSSSDARVTRQYARAVSRLALSIREAPGGTPMLIEGGPYQGCWLESTGTINTEILSRFAPQIAGATLELFARHARADGLIPYKILPSGASHRQIQMVSPLARTVWNHFALNPQTADLGFLQRMYKAMARHDQWLAAHRDTRGTGGLEAFCTFDTGHDLSPRFWHGSDTCYGDDPAVCDPDSPLLPYLAPDLTANLACQRRFLAQMARTLGLTDQVAPWEALADRAEGALWDHCFDPTDGFFYDQDRHGQPVKIQTDVLLRVLACGIGDDAFFEGALREYLLHTRKFFARYPFTSVALDDPRFDPSSAYNTWAGTTNVLSVIRAFHAFEAHGRVTEQYLAARPLVTAFYRMEKFSQCLNPWTGDEGFTEDYTPALLGLLDFTERFCGILPRPGELWFSANPLSADPHGNSPDEATTYERKWGGQTFVLENRGDGSQAFADGQLLFRCPRGVRVTTDAQGRVKTVTGMVPRTVEGEFQVGGRVLNLRLGGNQVLAWKDGAFEPVSDPGVVLPNIR